MDQTVNPFIHALVTALERRYTTVEANDTLLDWVSRYTTLNGRPYSVKNYPFQEAIMNDEHPNMVVRKCSQVGVTELQMRKAVAWLIRHPRTRMIYGIPTGKLYKQFSQTRLKPMIDRDAVFQNEDWGKQVRSLDTIQLQESFLHIRMVTEEDATSTPADFIMLDELDLANPKYVALYLSRLQNSDYKIVQKFSTPTLKGFGVDAGFNASDQRYYMLKCPHCGKPVWPEFNLDWCYFPDLPSTVDELTDLTEHEVAGMDLSKAEVRCKHCGLPLGSSLTGEWVAKHPSRTATRGYLISPFSAPKLTLASIVHGLCTYKKNNYIRGFYNTVLGRAYEDATTRIPLAAIETALEKGSPAAVMPGADDPACLGIDVGGVVHLVMGNPAGTRICLMEQIPLDRAEARILQLFKDYNIVAAAMDRYPETNLTNRLRDATKGILQPVHYATAPNAISIELAKDIFDVLEYVKVNRTKSLDAVKNLFLDQAVTVCGYSYLRDVITKQLRDNVRDERPECPAVWVKTEGDDHFFHAIGYYLLASKIRELIRETNHEEVRTMSVLHVCSMEKSMPPEQPGLPRRKLQNYKRRQLMRL